MTFGRLRPETVLQCAGTLTVSLQSGVPVHIGLSGRRIDCGAFTLAILDAFAQPTPLAAAVGQLRALAKGSRDWIEITSAIVRLHQEGVLVDAHAAGGGVAPGAIGFGGPGIHARMLDDEQRTSAYLDAIRKIVRPGDVVVEIGTGTGVLATAAAKAGAARVYAIESTEIATAAEAMFRANGISDRVRLVRGWSTNVELAERADVLISEIIGNEPLAENVLEVTADARARFMKPEARFIPRALRVFALPVELPPEELRKHTFHRDSVLRWGHLYALDFTALSQIRFDRPGVFYVKPHVPREWHSLSEPVLLTDVDLSAVSGTTVHANVTVNALKRGAITAVLAFFELDLATGTTLTTAPDAVSEASSWRTPVWTVGSPVPVVPGDSFTVRFDRSGGQRDWLSVQSA